MQGTPGPNSAIVLRPCWYPSICFPPDVEIGLLPLKNGELLSLRYSEDRQGLIQELLQDAGYERVFEAAWFPRVAKDVRIPPLFSAFFDRIAPEYEQIVRIKRNIACYEHLLRIALGLAHPSSRVLDFGCGPGLIMYTNAPAVCTSLVGFDFSEQMRSLARTKGMAVLEPSKFSSMESSSIDIVLLSYIIHFGIPEADYNSLIRILDTGGVLIGNVHKGIGYDRTFSYLASSQVLEPIALPVSVHGPLLTFRKRANLC